VLFGWVGITLAIACGPEEYTFVPAEAIGHCENDLFEPAAGETDKDCGGEDCRACELGLRCAEGSDCLEGECLEGFCQNPGCDNDVQDETETDIDCGGDCKPCTTGQICEVDRDCDSFICTEELVCAGATCDDGLQNGDETGRDCGGGMCDGCPPGSPCLAAIDCLSGVCDEETMVCVVFCVPGAAECDADLSVECETNLLTSPDHCGGCNMPCVYDHGVAGCVGGTCRLESCEEPWDDCNGDESDGCETDTSSIADACGGCNIECPAVNGTPSCEDSTCGIDCDDGFADCDGNPANGCEGSVNDVLHCGACDYECPEDDGKTAYCVDGDCGQTECEPGFGNCDGNPDNECEQDIATDPQNCGRCGGLCSVANGRAGCDPELGCVVAGCNDGWANCNEGNPDGGYSDGCEVNIEADSAHCGACGEACSVKDGTGRCSGGACSIGDCDDGFGDCDGDYDNGCEVDIFTDKENCGGCGSSGLRCDDVFPNATGACVDGGCVIDDCVGRFADCTTAAGCETNLDTSDGHCGACGAACQDVGGSNSCENGSCVLDCDATHATCDMNAANGCETATTGSGAVTHCGDCDTVCSTVGATSTTCNGSGVCSPTCDGTHASCDGDPANGCETATTGAGNEAHCGGCSPCSTSGASSVTCNNSGVCIPTCNSNRLNCNSANDGCETTRNTSNCAACGQQCLSGAGSPRHSTGTTCVVNGASSVCEPACEAGWGACSNPADGCTDSLETDENCGECDNDCPSGTDCARTGSSYACQERIVLANDADGAANTSSLTFSHTPTSGAHRMLVLAVVAESPGNGINGSRPDSITYGGTSITPPVFEQAGLNGSGGNCNAPAPYEYFGPDLFVYVVPESVIATKSGAQNVTINAATSPAATMIIANLVQLNGVRQSTPLSGSAGGFLGNCTSIDSPDPSNIGHAVTVATTGSRILSFASALWPSTTAPTVGISPSSGLTLTQTYASAIIDNGAQMRASFVFVDATSGSVPAEGSYTPTWSFPFSGRTTHLAVVVHPYQAP
jgi:hypothetical protein